MIVVIQGALAGAGHVLTGPDHLAGVAPLTVGGTPRLRPSLVGATWGLGHGLGVAFLGVLGQTLLAQSELEIASVWAERLVGFVLITIGVLAIRRSRALVVHEHTHTHDGEAHAHLHVHDHHHHGEDSHQGDRPRHGHRHAAFGIGVVHGLAGAGHFWAVIPSLAMGPRDATLFIGSYLLASVLIMTIFGALLGRITRAFGPRAVPRFMVAIGGLSILIGAWWACASFELV